MRPTPPASIRRAGVIVVVQGSVLLIAAAVMIIRALSGADQKVASGYGTALWFAIVGVGVVIGGLALTRGKRGGRAISVMLQILLIPVGWAMTTDSHIPWIGIPLLVVVVAVLALLFSPSAIQWFAADYAPDANDKSGR